MESIFRSLVIFTIVLSIVFWITPYIDHMWLTQEQIVLLNQNGHGATIPPNDFLYWGTLFIWLLISTGLFFYVNLAKSAFLIAYLVSILSIPFFGILILTAFETLLIELLTLTDGIIIAMLLFTSIGAKFAKKS